MKLKVKVKLSKAIAFSIPLITATFLVEVEVVSVYSAPRTLSRATYGGTLSTSANSVYNLLAYN